jgi:hypothetical protein
MSCQVSTAIRAPRVLLWLNDKTSEQRRTPCCSWESIGARPTITCACWTRTAACWRHGGSSMGWPGSKSCIPWWPPRPSSRQVAVGIETDRGLPVRALLAAGYQVYAVNPQVVGRYRGRHRAARAKSDRGDAKVLADLVRTDRHNHRQVAGDSPPARSPGRPRRGRPEQRSRGVQPPGDAGHLDGQGAGGAGGASLPLPTTVAATSPWRRQIAASAADGGRARLAGQRRLAPCGWAAHAPVASKGAGCAF